VVRRHERIRASRLVAAVWWVGAVMIAGVLLFDAFAVSGGQSVALRWAAEFWLLAGVLIWASLRLRLWALLSRQLQVITTLILLGLTVGHLLFLPASAYPFTHWSMYTMRQPTLTYAHFEMQSDGVDVGHLPMVELVPDTLAWGFVARLEQWLVRAEADEVAAERLLSAVMRSYLEAIDSPEVDSIDVRWCEVGPADGGLRSRCESVLTVKR
jgi:hypothetical protein